MDAQAVRFAYARAAKMSILASLTARLKERDWIRRLYFSAAAQRSIAALRYALVTSSSEKEEWRRRTADVLASPDNADIPRAADAGRIIHGSLVMHNEIRIRPGSYYGYPLLRLLQRNRGVHEPQEEKVFQEVLEFVPAGGSMLELGAYWGFYSLWFSRKIQGASCWLVEPNARALEWGRENFALNGLAARFVHGYVGAAPGTADDGTPIVDVDGLLEESGIRHLDVLHSDIQGAELDMLRGADRLLREKRVSYVFISTHSRKLHERCKAHLVERGYLLVASHSPAESFSVDGLIVARSPATEGPAHVSISIRAASA